ncbi:MAG TPA: response regulator [Anaerolineales bacterium]
MEFRHYLASMSTTRERILIVEADPAISDLIARQSLEPLGYNTSVVGEAPSAIQQVVQSPPDLIIANLNLPGLSGKDLLTALSSQGLQAPLVVIAEKGQEQGVIQAFRLGAVDILFWPARDAEIVRVVERALQQTREARARQKLDKQLEGMRLELERKLRDLNTILDMGRAIISVTDQRQLFDRILDGAQQLAEADICWLMVREDQTRTYLLAAQRNLPAAWARKLNQPVEDGISALVALSGETLSIHGSPLEKFGVATLGKSAAVLPMKIGKEVIGLLVVVRKADREIEKSTQSVLEAVTDFATISLVNARLFRAVEQRAGAARVSEKSRHALLESLKESIREGTQSSSYPLEALLSGQLGPLTAEQQQALKAIQNALQRLARTAEKTVPAEGVKLG